ncbi:major facilitator superfamily domain-containing protein [Pseudomassariella vexata]|uniref:Major facilitator superfamily domain-containing protein n=1 Tax=Pseudomassariella vexata TaxID=1141098 RepID=A0A1Y2DS72_9PEZI|nr:major facilitator superfamily domain-containing protein [Pseudomassariella vexata]ORY62111.1 major facilitator superfamily domain-containing protein [Pseudomassariella vexata]
MAREDRNRDVEKQDDGGLNNALHDSICSSNNTSHDADVNTIEQAPLEQAPTQRSRKSSTRERRPSAPGLSEYLSRSASNVLAQVASRFTTRSWAQPPPPPDGGLAAWTQVAMGWLVIFTTWGYVNSFGAFQTYYTQTMPQPPSTISWIGSVQTWLTLIIGAFSGRLLDAGLFVPTFFVGAVIQVVGMVCMSFSRQYWALMLTQGVLTGIGGGIFFTPSLALVTTYFSKRRGLAVGLVTTGNSAGGMIYPVVVRQLIPQLGFAWTARVLAFINLGCLAVVLAFMRPRLPPRKSGPVIDMTAFKEPVYLSFVGGLFFVMWANYYTFYYIASFGREILGFSYSSASILIILINGAGLPFRVIPPLISDKVGPLNVMVPVTITWSIVVFCWLAVGDVSGLYVFTCFYGILAGSFQCLLATVIASITKRLDMVGTRLGMTFSICSFASLTGPPIGGALQGAADGKFTGAQIWAAFVTALGCALICVARFSLAGWNPRTKC